MERREFVAYSAICAHRLTYPTRDISFISYRAEKSAGNRFSSVIHCCSEHSQYDPAEGARVVAGPAPQPLAAILLEHDAGTDEVHAIGTLGGELFNEFFEKYAFWLERDDPFPPLERALKNPPGLLCAGGDLSTERLLEAYRRGIFPWFSLGEPLLWWSPDPRMVLECQALKVARSLAKSIRNKGYEVRVDTAFREVLKGCASR